MLKVTDNPPMLPPGASDPAAVVGSWWVAHVKPRAEKALAWDLIGRAVPHFLPMASRTAVWGGRRRTVLTPVFPSYVFFAGDASARVAALSTGRVVSVLPVPQQAMLVRELQAIHVAVGSRLTLDPYPFTAVGRRCRVARGPLRGIEGIVVRRDDAVRLVLQITTLGQSVALEVGADVLEPAD